MGIHGNSHEKSHVISS